MYTYVATNTYKNAAQRCWSERQRCGLIVFHFTEDQETRVNFNLQKHARTDEIKTVTAELRIFKGSMSLDLPQGEACSRPTQDFMETSLKFLFPYVHL